jgi:hypothetical protein
MTGLTPHLTELPLFDRKFWDGTFRCTQIGTGPLGGKATGLVFIKDLLAEQISPASFLDVEISVPIMAVIATDCFDQFMAQNRLAVLPFKEMSDARIAHAFQNADLPMELLGDLRALTLQVKTPLAIRSSSLLEDALGRPFAGVYATKMIPNNQPDPDSRFRRLVEAIKFVYASTYFREARDYRMTDVAMTDEKMAVIIQEVVGLRHGERFYPDIAGVGRSYNYYALDPARPDEGVVTLALGLGKTIVDGGVAWSFSPAYPHKPPPFASVDEMLDGTQRDFWAVNMGNPPAYDPVSETEYLARANLADAEADGVLDLLVSTYDSDRDRVVPGVGAEGPRIVNFSPILVQERFPITALVKALLAAAEKALNTKVEIEFALTLPGPMEEERRARLGFLQVRSTMVPNELVEVTSEELTDALAVVASDMAIGNGAAENIQDIVFVRLETFSPMSTPVIAEQLEAMNRELQEQRRPFVLIGFGRWGSSHPSLGIPVNWSQISGAQTIVEATLPEMNVELSQGSHFFHNLSSFGTSYFMVQHGVHGAINWDWLNRQPVVHETDLIRHVRPEMSLSVRVDGRSRRGVIVPHPNGSTTGTKL